MKKILKEVIAIIILIFILSTTVQAMSVKLETNPSELEVNEEINVKVILDESVVTSDFKLKYDAESFEFIDTETKYLHVKDYINYTYIASVYANLEGKGTKEFDFKFKATKEVEDAIFEVIDMNCTTENGDVYDDSNLEQSYKSNKVKVIISTTNSKDPDYPSDEGKDNSTNKENDMNKENITGKDGTVANGILPYAGVNTIIIISIVIFIILAIFFKKKEKLLRKILPLFILGIVITSAANINNSYAYTQTIKIFKLDNQTDNIDIYSIMLNTVDTQKYVTASELKDIITNINEIKTKDNNPIEDTNLVATGSMMILKDGSKSKIILYGDATGEGKINSNDIYVMIQHMLNKGKLTGIYAKAVNFSNKGDLNDENIDENDISKHIDFLLGILETDLVEELPEGAKDLSQYIDVKFANKEDEKLQTGDKCGFYIVLGEQTPKAHCKVIKKVGETETVLLDTDITETKAYQVDVEENVEYEISASILSNNTTINSITAKINMIPYLKTEEGAKIKKDISIKLSNDIEHMEQQLNAERTGLEEERHIQRQHTAEEIENAERNKKSEEDKIKNQINDQLIAIQNNYDNEIMNIRNMLKNGNINKEEASSLEEEATLIKHQSEQNADIQLNQQIEQLNHDHEDLIQGLNRDLEEYLYRLNDKEQELVAAINENKEKLIEEDNRKIKEMEKYIIVQKLN